MSHLRLKEGEVDPQVLIEMSSYIDFYISNALSKTIGVLPTREELEDACSKIMGTPVRFPDYDPKTGVATFVEIAWPMPITYITCTIEVGDDPLLEG